MKPWSTTLSAAAVLCAAAAVAVTALPAQHVLTTAHRPVRGDGHALDIGNASMAALLDRYAPVLKLSIQERFFPSSIDYMLPYFKQSEDKDKRRRVINPTLTPLTMGDLPRLPSTFLNILEDHNPQPFLDREAEYLLGPDGRNGGRNHPGPDGRARISEEVYGFWVDQPHGVVDLWYWTYYPFNFGKPVGPFGFLGHHVSDWERLRVRTINGSAVAVDYNTHTGGRFSAGTFRWTDVPKVDDRPVAYVAAGSHGVWPTPGDHVYADVLDVFKLVDVTDDYGPLWDTKGRVVPVQYRESSNQEPKTHTGTHAWLNFPGHWGNRGVNNCWWHRAVGYCQLIDAPPGPNRDLLVPPQCILAPINRNNSIYTFYLNTVTADAAAKAGVTTIKVEQICAKPKKDDEDDDGGDEGDDDGYDNARGDDGRLGRASMGISHQPRSGQKPLTRYNEDGRKEEDFRIWSTSGSTPFRGRDQHRVSVPECAGRRSAVKAYKLHLCLANGKCHIVSSERKVCTFRPGSPGFASGHAVTVDDVDDWDIRI